MNGDSEQKLKDAFPDEKPKTRARKKAQRETKPAADLIAALKFVKSIQKTKGELLQTHCVILNKNVIVTNYDITISVKIDEDFTACVNTSLLIEALSNCKGSFSIAAHDSGITVSSDDFTSNIEGVPLSAILDILPNLNPNIAPCDNRVVDAMKVLHPVAAINHVDPALNTVLLQANIALATNGRLLMQYEHGIDLPPELNISTESAKFLSKIKKEIVGFGYSEDYVTFYFSDETIIQIKRCHVKYPVINCTKLLDSVDDAQWINAPSDFFTALKAVSPFAANNIIVFSNCEMRNNSDGEVTTYSVDRFPDGIAFNKKYLSLLEPAFQFIQFDGISKIYCEGLRCKAILMAIDLNVKPKCLPDDDDINF